MILGSNMKKLSIKVIWLLILILFLIAVGLLFLLPHTNDPLTKILIVIVVIIMKRSYYCHMMVERPMRT